MPLIPNSNKNNQNDQNKAPVQQGVQFNKSAPIYTFSDLILSDKTIDELKTVVSAQKNWKKVFVDWGLSSVMKERKNLFVNLYGESGTGKSMSAHAIADALGKKLICVNYADIESKYVGETSKNLSKLFSDPTNKDDIIFFDEADALLSKRVTDMSSATDVSVNQTRSVLLTLLNSYEGMVIFATNFISNYDSAFMRRIHYHIRFELPNAELREKLWKHYIPSQMPVNADIHKLAEEHNGLSGSDISTAVLKAALNAARNDSAVVSEKDFTLAVESIIASKKANKSASNTVVTKSEIVDEKDVPLSIRNKII
ncbi:ATPase family associated with various cellular activities (AAA) [Ruminococcus sp. YRD2003]|uniref:ATP-binding protein n=1 Tax=Ruminococcus sp. YRD2003 TaxID=1452313 RepID=UPI0008D8B6AA|nr:ATPase family associated with various cellular activities (AAA) [Ruminococcus flavefaciens]